MTTNPAHPQQEQARPGHWARYFLLGALASLVGLLLIGVALPGAWILLWRSQGRISPNVYVLGTNLGGMTATEATDALGRAKGLDSLSIVLRDGEQQWTVPWSEAGGRLDVGATVQAARAIGHSGGSLQAHLVSWFQHHEVDPILAADSQTARAALERLAAQISVAPVNAAFRPEGDRAVAVPGQPGRALDVDATLPRLASALTDPTSKGQVDLTFRAVPPDVADAGPFLAQAEEMLQRQLELSAYDVLTDETFTWTLDRSATVRWLYAAKPDDGPATLIVDPQAIQTTLESLATGMGQGRSFRLEEAAGQLQEAFDAGGGPVELYLTHPERSYTVQPGDVLEKIALRFGIPLDLLAKANPDIKPDWVLAGQELVVPSPDVMLPNMPVRNKRIVVSLSEQRMRIYENGEQLYDWAVSTGLPETPTISGAFQILAKEENAFSKAWDLEMPQFQAIYPAGTDFYNGIHGLPTRDGKLIWEELPGQPASYGCIMLGTEEAKTLFEWTEVGVPVIVEP